MTTPYFKDNYYKLSFPGRILVKLASVTAMTLVAVGAVTFLVSPASNLNYAGVLLAIIVLERLLFFRRSRKSLKKLPKNGKVNVAEYVSPKAKTMLVPAINKSLTLNREFASEVALLVLETKEATEAIKRLGVLPDELKSKLKELSDGHSVKISRASVQEKISSTIIRAFQSAMKAGEGSIMPADLLVALVAEESGSLKKTFNLFGISPEDLEKALIFGRLARTRPVRQTSFFARRMPMTKIRDVNRAWTSRPTPILDSFGYDITNMAVAGKSGFLIGHEKEYDRLEDILSRPTKPNALLIGDPGVGKDVIIGHLAYRMIKDQVSSQLFDKRLVVLDVASLISGADQAEIQERTNVIINEIKAAGNIVLYVPEIHNLGRTSEAGGGLSVANALVPALANDDFPLIGTTYPREYKRFIEQDSSFAAVFEPIQVQEISEDEAEEYLSYDSVILEREWKIKISFAAIKKAVTLAKKYFHNKPLPSSADDLLKESLSEARRKGNKILDEEDVIRAAEKRINVPIHRAGAEEAKGLLNLEETIHKRLVDQEEAVSAVSRALREYRSGLTRRGGPIASFLFVGPTGVGKTELAKTLASIQFGSEDMMVRFDMSEYQSPNSTIRLIGGSDGKIYGSLTESVLEKPYSLVLLDEFEKANGDVLNLFLQVLDDGRLTDGTGRTVDFQNTIIIATSNAHSSFIKESLDKGDDPLIINETLKKRLVEYFKPELLNRFSDIIAFKTLSVSDMGKIATLQLKSLAKTLENNQGITMTFTNDAVGIIAREGYDPTFGARPLRGAISKLIKDPLSSEILSGAIKKGDTIEVTSDENGLVFKK